MTTLFVQFVAVASSLFAVYLDDIILCQPANITSYYVIIYADDILLISSSICELQRDICERELNGLIWSLM